MEWGAAIVSLLGIVLWGLKQWQANQPARKVEEAHDATQDGRQALVDGDVPAIEHRVDSLLQEGGGNSPAGIQSTEDIEGRISQL